MYGHGCRDLRMLYNEFDYITDKISDVERKNSQEIVLKNVEGVYEPFVTVEYYPIHKLVVLHTCLSDLSKEYSLKHDGAVHEGLEWDLNAIKRVMNSPNDLPTVIENDRLIILNAYGYRSKHKQGRIYGKWNSMALISRQLRYYLFKDIYLDVDLKNAHPTILLAYGESRGLDAPVLSKYVSERDDFLADIMKRENLSRGEAKIQVLRTLNLVTDKKVLDSLKGLHKEIANIRELLYQEHFGGALSGLGDYCLTRDSFKNKDLEKQKVSLQAHYCYGEESKCLEILREVCIHKGLLNKEAVLRKDARNLSFIPFFDGAYINFDGLEKSELEQIKNDVNQLVKPYVFEIKDIEPDWTSLSEEILTNYEVFFTFCSELNTRQLELIITYLGIEPFALDDSRLNKILNNKNNVKDVVEGNCEEFNLLVQESAELYAYKVRRAILSYINRGLIQELRDVYEKKNEE